MAENTFYGLANKLQVASYTKVSKNLFKIECKQNGFEKIYLYILFLSPEIIRFHYSASETFNLDINSHLEFENFCFKTQDFITDISENLAGTGPELLSFKTEKLVVYINKAQLAVSIFDHQLNLLSEDLTELGFWKKGRYDTDNTKEIRCYKRYQDLNSPPIIYGLGDKTGVINHWGKRFRNEPLDALGYNSENTDPLYKDIPFFIHLERETKMAHGIFFDNFFDKFFDFGKERKPTPYYYFGAEQGELNYYFFAGPAIKDVIKGYLDLTGKPVLMPAFSFGYLASGMAYTESENAEKKIEDFYKTANEKDLQASAFHLSSGYLLNEQHKRMQFKWSEKRFKDPKKFISKILKKYNTEFCANVKPVLLDSHESYAEVADKGLFISDSVFRFDEPGNQKKGTKAILVNYWGGKGSYFDYTKKECQAWWKEKLKENIFANAVRGVWNDNNEYEIDESHDIKSHKREQALIMSKLAHEAYTEFQSKDAKPKRPWILSRSGYSGIQKYAQTWTGDNASSFHSLKYDIAVLNSMNSSGLFHTGADVGGFFGESPDSELLTRWVQNGCFMPRFCIHSYKEQPTEPWSHAKNHLESFEIIKNYMVLRKSLQPYIYQANYKASTEAKPIQRMTALDFQNDTNTYEQSFDYIFGDSLLIAPVYESGANLRDLYLPESSEVKSWIDWWSMKEFQAGKIISYPVGLETIPLFVRADSFIPLEIDEKTLELRIFLSTETYDALNKENNKELSYSFYEDDGDTLAYLDGDSLITEFSLRSSDQGPNLVIESEVGAFKSKYKVILVKIVVDTKVKEINISRDKLKKGIII